MASASSQGSPYASLVKGSSGGPHICVPPGIEAKSYGAANRPSLIAMRRPWPKVVQAGR